LSDPINRRLGRRGAVFVGASICLIGNIGSALSQSWQFLLVLRFVLGIGLAIDAATVSMFAAECAPASIRGGLAVSWQLLTAFGIFVGFGANVIVFNVRLLQFSEFTLTQTVWIEHLETSTGSSFPPNHSSSNHVIHVSRITCLVPQRCSI
jgi:MFS family permease